MSVPATTNGIEGHGDLKPSNILYNDLRKKYAMPKDVLFYRLPFNIKLADFGWADAWVDYGFTNRALRQYLAPERLDGEEGRNGLFFPEKSDIFAMGIIACELLSGGHPAPNLRKAAKSEGSWKRWVHNGERYLSKIHSERLKKLIVRCLDPNPVARPSSDECMHEVCEELRYAHDINFEPQLHLFRKEAANSDGVSPELIFSDASLRTLGLGPEQEFRSKKRLEERLKTIEVKDLETCKNWTALSNSLICFLNEDGSDDSVKRIESLKMTARYYLESILGNYDRKLLEQFPFYVGYPEYATRFEKLSEVIMRLADIANCSYENAADGELKFGNLSLAAFAFGTAARIRVGHEAPESIEAYL